MTNRVFASFLLLTFFTAGVLSAQVPRSIDTLIQHWMQAEHIPGLSVAVASHGKLLYSKAFGKSDVENNVPATIRTKFRLASISKPFTAAAVMQLVEQGRIALDSTIQTYVPEFPQKPWPITIRQLLGHQGGIRHYRGVEEERRIGTTLYKDLTDALSIFSNDSLRNRPGERYTYTTFGYNLLGVAVERASGLTFGEYLADHIFMPLKMEQTVLDRSADIIPNRTAAYTLDSTGRLRNAFAIDPSYKHPGGGILSTTEDLVKFGTAMMHGTVVSPETFALMNTSGRTSDSVATNYGLGWSIGKGEMEGTVSHNGGQQGATSTLVLVPARDHVVAILTNLDGVKRIAQVAYRIEKLIPTGK